MQAPEARSAWFSGWRGALVALFCIAMVLVGSAEIFAMAGRYGLLGNSRPGRIGIGEVASAQYRGWVAIERVDAGGSAARAGIQVGDLVRFAEPLMLSSEPPPGTIATLTVRHGGNTRVLHVAYEPLALTGQAFWLNLWFSLIGAAVFTLALGALVLWRGWGSIPALALGLGLVGYATSDTVPWWMVDSMLRLPWLALVLMRSLCAIGLSLFPIVLYHLHVAPLRRGWWIVIAIAAILNEVSAIAQTVAPWFCWYVPASGHIVEFAMTITVVIIAFGWSWRGAWAGTGLERGRFAILLFADSLVLVSTVIWLIGSDGIGLVGRDAQLWVGALNLIFGFVAFPLVLAYAVLRHRVVDLGFALNRTVVYGTVSAILLASFGLIEWGIEHLLPEEWVKASAWIDAGAAVLVYLAFHRVHDAVEHRVEEVFFRQWQHNEDTLRRFVATATHFDDEATLARAFADELSRFAGEGRVALYRRDPRARDNGFARVAGSWTTAPRTLAGDDAAYARMRAERQPLDLTDMRTDLPGALALPMIDHGTVSGLVLMDPKGNGALYRPDEIAVLGRAAHEVGLALAALHAGYIESENRLLKAQVTRLSSIIGTRMDHAGA